MRGIPTFVVSLLFLVSIPVASIFASETPVQSNWAPGELIVKFADSKSGEGFGYGLMLKGYEVIERYSFVPGLARIRIPEGQDVVSAIMELSYSKGSRIEYAEPNYSLKIFDHVTPPEPVQGVTNDPMVSQQWALKKMDASMAWELTTGSKDVVVAVIDTGVDYLHEDLVANIWRNPGEIAGNGLDDDGNGFVDDIHGYDFRNSDGDPMDDNGHGTHCSGIIGASANNEKGIAGINWNVSIMAIKFASSFGSAYTADALKAIEYAVENGADILSNSWGGGGDSEALEEAVRVTHEAGVLFVAAAGNNHGRDNDKVPVYPASYDFDNVISVAATDQNDKFSPFSNIGVISVDLAAPGSAILSSMPGNEYKSKYGTSMACPQVSGAAALLLSRYPDLTNLEIKKRILQSTDPLETLQGKVVTRGRLNLSNALAGIYPDR